MIEILVTLVVLGVMAAIAVPTFYNWYPNYRLKAAAREVYTTFQTARLAAIKEGTATTFAAVTFDTTNNSYQAFIDTNNDWVPTGSEQILRQVTLPADVKIAAVTLPSARTRFNDRGLVDSGTGYVELQNDKNKTETITLLPAGSAQIQ